jgi:SAM-dependent methyltransferase
MSFLRNTVRLFWRGYDMLTGIAEDVRVVVKTVRASREAADRHQVGVARALKRVAGQTERAASAPAAIEHVGSELRELRRDVEAMHGEARAGLRQYHLQLGRLARAVDLLGGGASTDPRLGARAIPLEAPEPAPSSWGSIGVTHPDPEGREWTLLRACPGCGHDELTVVNPWNKLLLLDKAPDDSSARYDYAICHACGILAATRRPFGARFHFLLEHFGEVTAKRDGRAITNPVLNPYPLDEADRDRLRRLAEPGVFVSDLSSAGKAKAYLPGLLRDRFERSGHVDIIGSLLQPRNARVLEVRAKTGALVDGLRRYWGADVHSMPIWESQQFLVQEFYGIPASRLIDFDRFAIPFDGTFDLIVCQHMLTHALRPAEFLAELRRKLNPGGHIYLYNEPDDIEFLGKGQSMIAHLNPLHMQAFDQESLARVLAANGFEVVFMKRHDLTHVCLARLTPDARMTPMDAPACQRRLEQYRKAFDRSILRLDETISPRVAEQWLEVVERAVAGGVAEFDKNGRLRLVSSWSVAARFASRLRRAGGRADQRRHSVRAEWCQPAQHPVRQHLVAARRLRRRTNGSSSARRGESWCALLSMTQ